MTIVLPHGVLYRGGSEYQIRKQLVEYNHIDAIIGLPEKVFYGTGISTIVMVLKRKTRVDDKILFIDASAGFEKDGKNNRLRACDIKKVVDAVTTRTETPDFADLSAATSSARMTITSTYLGMWTAVQKQRSMTYTLRCSEASLLWIWLH